MARATKADVLRGLLVAAGVAAVLAAVVQGVGGVAGRAVPAVLLPFAAAEHPGLDGAFSVLEFPDPDDGRIVCVEAMTSTLYIEKTRDVGIYRLAFDQLRSAAVGPDETAAAITVTAAAGASSG